MGFEATAQQKTDTDTHTVLYIDRPPDRTICDRLSSTATKIMPRQIWKMTIAMQNN